VAVEQGQTAGIQLKAVTKTYQSAAGMVSVLKGIDLDIRPGEFVAVIGKSGSGKSTLLNCITGIDRPSSGEVWVAGTPIHTLSESQMAKWRGRNLGIVFQFFQLLPTLTLLENVVLPMVFCGLYTPPERKERGLALLGQVGLDAHAYKLPSAVSGGQQQRAAIARALANDAPILVADEPTGNLDSKMAAAVFEQFEQLVAAGKTVVMVTHDHELADRVKRTIIIADGEIVNQYVARALATLDLDQLTFVSSQLRTTSFNPGQVIVRQGDPADYFYVVTKGAAEVYLEREDGSTAFIARLTAGKYFGEIAVLRGGPRTATVRAGMDGVEVMALTQDVFGSLVSESDQTREQIDQAIRDRLDELALKREAPAAVSVG
jgi:ABC-type lipoprotein export system ATPase subunit